MFAIKDRISASNGWARVIINMDNQEFQSFLHSLTHKIDFPNCITNHAKQYFSRKGKSSKLEDYLKTTLKEVIGIRNYLLNEMRAKEEFRKTLQTSWVDCEKKMFNCFAFCYCQIHGLTLEDLLNDDQALNFLSRITTMKPLLLMKYQVLSELQRPQRPSWTKEEDNILSHILKVEKNYDEKKVWQDVSREVFMRSESHSYKPPKNCRERWINHLNPALDKSWSKSQELQLLESVKQLGPKWSEISKTMQSKTQHMVKNKYVSTLQKMKKKEGLRQEDESVLVDMAISSLIESSRGTQQSIRELKNRMQESGESKNGMEQTKTQIYPQASKPLEALEVSGRISEWFSLKNEQLQMVHSIQQPSKSQDCLSHYCGFGMLQIRVVNRGEERMVEEDQDEERKRSSLNNSAHFNQEILPSAPSPASEGELYKSCTFPYTFTHLWNKQH